MRWRPVLQSPVRSHLAPRAFFPAGCLTPDRRHLHRADLADHNPRVQSPTLSSLSLPSSGTPSQPLTLRPYAPPPPPPPSPSPSRLSRPSSPPLRVAKTRLQLDGELQARKPLAVIPSSVGGVEILPRSTAATASGRVYTSALDCMQKTWKFEGIRGIQRGLGAAVRSLSLVDLRAAARKGRELISREPVHVPGGIERIEVGVL